MRCIRRAPAKRCPRTGLSAVELILMLPLLLIMLAAVVEFGMLQAGQKHIEYASRMGVKQASETMTLPFDGATMVTIRTVVDRELETAGFGPNASAGVTLRHTVAGGGPSSQTIGDCSDPIAPALPDGAVRVTVCVDSTKVAPDLLSTFGFSLVGRRTEATTTYPHK